MRKEAEKKPSPRKVTMASEDTALLLFILAVVAGSVLTFFIGSALQEALNAGAAATPIPVQRECAKTTLPPTEDMRPVCPYQHSPSA